MLLLLFLQHVDQTAPVALAARHVIDAMTAITGKPLDSFLSVTVSDILIMFMPKLLTSAYTGSNLNTSKVYFFLSEVVVTYVWFSDNPAQDVSEMISNVTVT